jgi:Zn-dependent protease
MTADLIRTVLVFALPVLLAITLHEVAHGHAARALGDDTAASLGRLSLNPLRHIDPVGTVLMPVLLYVATAGAFTFGYAKPVPVDVRRLRSPRRDMALVALAGPGANLLMALLWTAFGLGLVNLGQDEPFWLLMARAGIFVNLVMAFFNLLPLLPLDGGRILVGVLPLPAARALAATERWGFFIVVALLLIGLVDRYWLMPLVKGGISVLSRLDPASFFFLMSLPS